MGLFQVGRYEILAELGRGGMATVYHAHDPVFHRDVAIKMLPAELLHDPSFRVRFEREARTIAALEHPTIVPVYDFGEYEGQPYFVMRLMVGKSLAERIAQGSLSLGEIVRIINRIAFALDEAHLKGIVHRDLKPGNILFDQNGEPYLSDFGIAKLSEMGGSTITGNAIVGTPAYMSPEQATGETDVDGRSDIYSLGVILFEMLTGKVPFESDTPMGQAIKHVTENAPSVAEINKNLPVEVTHVVEKAMAKRKFARYNTARELVMDLVEAAGVSAQKEEYFPGISTAGDNISPPEGRQRTTPVPVRPTSKPATPYPIRVTPSKGNQPIVTPLSLVKGSQPASSSLGLKGRIGRQWILIFVGMIIFISLGIGIVLFLNPGEKAESIAKLEETATPIKSIVPTKVELTLTATTPNLDIATNVPPTLTPTITQTPSSVQEQTPTHTPSPTVLDPEVGGANKMAMIRGNEIWVVNLDGTNLTLVTKAGGTKSNLQWTPDGKSILYISGKSIHQIAVDNTDEDDPGELILTANWADYLAGFRISPDSKYMALSLSDGLFIVPYDPVYLKQIRRPEQLRTDLTCLEAPTIKTKAVEWSDDSKSLAAVVIGTLSGKKVEVVRVYDVSQCQVQPKLIDEFPGTRFEMEKYAENPVIQSFGWDGNFIFGLNVNVFNGYGTIYNYNMSSRRVQTILPLGNACCFRDFQWSPDDTYFLFTFKDSRYGNTTEIYFVEYATLSTGIEYKPIPIPSDFFTSVNDRPQPALRKVP